MRAVLERDFLREVSRGRAFLVRSLVAAILSAAILVVAAVEYDELARRADEVAVDLFRAGAFSLLALLALWTPPMTVEAILEERQQGTLSLVLAAPVHPAGLALGKILARSGAVLSGALAAVPCLAVPLLLGGVPWSSVVALVVTTTAVVLELAAWSVFVSSISKRLATAVVLAFVLPAARWTAWGALNAWAGDGSFHEWTVPLVTTFPLGPLMEIMEPGLLAKEVGSIGSGPLPPFWTFLLAQPWWSCLAFSALLAALSAAASARRLAREEEPWFLTLPSFLRRTAKAAAPRPPASPFPSRLPRVPTLRRLFGHGSPGLNPVVWKEARQLNTATSRPLYYTVLVVLLCIFAAGIGDENERDVWRSLSAEMVLLCLVGCVQGAAAFGHERSQGSYDLLRSSPLPAWDIVLGKVTGGVVGLGFLAAVPLCHVVIASLSGTVEFIPTLAALLLCSTLPVYWTVQGLSCSANHEKVRPAMVRALAAFGTVLVAAPLLGSLGRKIGILDWRDSQWFLMATPPATVFGTLDGFQDLFRNHTWNWEGEEEKAMVWCVLMAAGAAAHVILMRFRLAGRFDADRE